MGFKSLIFRKKMERHLPLPERALNPIRRGLKAYARTTYLLYVKPRFTSLYNQMKFIARVPFPVLFVFYLFFIIIVTGIFMKIEYSGWVDAISTVYPDVVLGTIDAETGRVLPSPLDSIMLPYNAKNIGHSYFEMNLMIAMFLGFVWKMHNDGAPQSFKFKGHNG